MAEPQITLKEYESRRNKLLKSLNNFVGLIFSGKQSSHLPEDWRPHPNFEYLTGITTEQDAVLMLDPTNPVASRQAMLFLRPLDPELEKWDGYRDEISLKLKESTGIETIFRSYQFPRFLLAASQRAKKLACLHSLAMHNQPVSIDLEVLKKVAERVPGVVIEDRSDLLALARSAKSNAEVKMLKQAVDITAHGYEAVLKTLKPGMNEFDVQETLEHAYKTNGARGTYYGTIAGAGLNSTVLHYNDNDQVLKKGDLICIDSAAGYCGYSADITRTYPISGKFTKRQREIYDIVLKAELAAIKAVKPGTTFAKIDKAARDIINKAGYGDYFIHGIGHHLGLEVHDITPISSDKLKTGAVITIEPGIYLPDEKIGIRIEDDILVTKDGSRNLSAKIPKKAADIEKLMAKNK